jgi:hypothetical protein
MLGFFGFWAQPRYAGSGFPLQFASLRVAPLHKFRFNPLRLADCGLFLSNCGHARVANEE